MKLRALLMCLLASLVQAQMLTPRVCCTLWGWDALSNTELHADTKIVDYRVTLDHSATTLTNYTTFFICKAGYAGGTGGTISIYAQTDDGTALHRPSGVTVGSVASLSGFTLPSCFNYTVALDIPNPTQGQILHILHKNVDADPVTNWISLDHGSCTSCSTKWSNPQSNQPGLTELASTDNGATWTENYRSTPIFSVAYSDAVNQGQPYYDSKLFAVSAQPIRESFIPVANRSGNAIQVYLISAAGGPVTMTLQNAALSTIAQTTITLPPSSTSTFYTFPIPQTTLAAGTQYYVQFAGRFSVRSLEYGGTTFPWTATFTGACQLYNGASWAACDSNNRYDLPVGLVNLPVSVTGVSALTGKTVVQ